MSLVSLTPATLRHANPQSFFKTVGSGKMPLVLPPLLQALIDSHICLWKEDDIKCMFLVGGDSQQQGCAPQFSFSFFSPRVLS